MKRFTQETLEVDEADDKVQLTTFKAGLRSRDLVTSLMKNPLKTMAEMILKAQKYTRPLHSSPTSAIRTSTAVSTRIMAITQKIAET